MRDFKNIHRLLLYFRPSEMIGGATGLQVQLAPEV